MSNLPKINGHGHCGDKADPRPQQPRQEGPLLRAINYAGQAIGGVLALMCMSVLPLALLYVIMWLLVQMRELALTMWR